MQKAFTLIELLVVVLIIGILSAIALPQYQKAVIKTRFSTLKSLVKSIAVAQEVYYLANNTYATSFDDLDIDLPAGKKDNSTKIQYFYDWGDCRIINIVGYDSIECKNNLANMSYQIRLQHAIYGPGLRRCITYTADLTDIHNQICKAESRADSPNCCENNNIKEWIYR